MQLISRLIEISRIIAAFGFVIPATYFDVKRRIIPNKLLPIGIISATIIILLSGLQGENCIIIAGWSAFAGMFLGGGIFALANLFSHDSIGMGDIKAFGVLGLIIGGQTVFIVVIYTLLATCIFGIILILCGKASKKSSLPLAPFMLIGITAVFLTELC